jgi:hypothetical protein
MSYPNPRTIFDTPIGDTNLNRCAEAFDKLNRLAKLDGEWYRCSGCGHKLARRVQGYVCTTEQAEKHGAIEIKCKHRSGGETCNTVNVMEV